MTKKQLEKQRYYQKHKGYVKEKAREYYYRVRKGYLEENKERFQPINKIKNNQRLYRRRKVLAELRKEKGNKCSKCDYNKDPRILHFHHLRDKLAEVSFFQTETKIRAEAEKCILLCPNCHAIHHLTTTNDN